MKSRQRLARLGAVTALVAASLSLPTASATAAEEGASAGTDYGRMMLVLDSSGSMKEPAGGGQTKIQAAKTALDSVIDELPDEAEVGLRVFGSEVFSRSDRGACQDTELAVEPSTDNRDDLHSAVQEYKPYGETPIPAALKAAADDLGSEGTRSLVLVSDGESTCAPDPCKVAKRIAGTGIDLQIDVVGLSVSGQARSQLQCIAENGNGTYYDADNADEISSKITRVSQRAVRPFTLTGTPIEGGTEQEPTPITVGAWTDTLGRETSSTASRTYSFERTTADTTLRAAVTTQNEKGSISDVDISIVDPEGSTCATGDAFRGVDTRMVMSVQAVAAPENECSEPGEYQITVGRDVTGDAAIPIGVRITEEPPITDPGVAEPIAEDGLTAPQVSGGATPVLGAASFEGAEEIGSGRWSSDIVPGEALLYRIPLEFGQSARIRMHAPKATEAMKDEFGSFPPMCKIDLFNPMQSRVSQPDDVDECETMSARIGGSLTPTDVVTGTPAVSREAIDVSSSGQSADYSTAGDYYFGISLEDADYSIEFPFTIEVEIVGEPQDGPTYADDATWSVADDIATAGEETDESADSDEPAAKTTEDDDGFPFVVVAGGAAVVLLVGAGLALGLLLGRRRRT